jgi:hypothetical protein
VAAAQRHGLAAVGAISIAENGGLLGYGVDSHGAFAVKRAA